MIRWLVRKVVKYAIEELKNSEELQWLLCRYAKGKSSDFRTSTELGQKTHGVEVSSMESLAKAMTAQSGNVEMRLKNESTVVSSNKGRSAQTIDQLSKIGD